MVTIKKYLLSILFLSSVIQAKITVVFQLEDVLTSPLLNKNYYKDPDDVYASAYFNYNFMSSETKEALYKLFYHSDDNYFLVSHLPPDKTKEIHERLRKIFPNLSLKFLTEDDLVKIKNES